MIRWEDPPRISCPLQPAGPPAYEIADSQLEVGFSFGNRKCWIGPTGSALKGTGSAKLGMGVSGALAIRWASTVSGKSILLALGIILIFGNAALAGANLYRAQHLPPSSPARRPLLLGVVWSLVFTAAVIAFLIATLH